MSQQPSHGAMRLFLTLLTSLLLVFSLLGTAGSVLGAVLLQSPSFCLSQIVSHRAAEKVHSTLQTQFDTQYNTTAVPAEVYMNVLTVSWLEDAMTTWLDAGYAQMHGADCAMSIDNAPLEDSITAFFEKTAEEQQYEKDSVYDEKLAETIRNAETTVKDAVDVYQIDTLRQAGIWAKLNTLRRTLLFTAPLCTALCAVWVVLLRRLRCGTCYWSGTSLFAGGVLLTAPAAWVLASGVIARFAWKEPAVYAVLTGTMTGVSKIVLWIGIGMLAAGLVLWVAAVRHAHRSAPEKQR